MNGKPYTNTAYGLIHYGNDSLGCGFNIPVLETVTPEDHTKDRLANIAALNIGKVSELPYITGYESGHHDGHAARFYQENNQASTPRFLH